jgi:hypothetical protein
MFFPLLLSLLSILDVHAAAPLPDKAHLGSILSHIAVWGCPKVPAHQWAQVLLLNRPVVHAVKFGKGCDIQGTATISRQPFTVDCEVRHVPNVSRIKAVVSGDAAPRFKDAQVDVTVHATDGQVIGTLGDAPGKELAAFTAVYKTTIGIDGKPRGTSTGEYHITRIKGEKADIYEKMSLH